MGRPAKQVTPDSIIIAREFAALGATYEKIAYVIGIGLTTLKKWVKTNEDFATAIRGGGEIACAKVVGQVYRRALGYTYIEENYQLRIIRNGNGEPLLNSDGSRQEKLILVSSRHKHQPPDVPAAKFFLWNRTKNLPPAEQWTDRQHYNHTSSDSSMSPTKMITADMTPKEAARLYLETIREGKR